MKERLAVLAHALRQPRPRLQRVLRSLVVAELETGDFPVLKSLQHLRLLRSQKPLVAFDMSRQRQIAPPRRVVRVPDGLAAMQGSELAENLLGVPSGHRESVLPPRRRAPHDEVERLVVEPRRAPRQAGRPADKA